MLKTVINHIGSWRFTPNLSLPKSLYAANGHPVPPRDRGRGMAMACPEAAAVSIISTLFKPLYFSARLPLVTIVYIPIYLTYMIFRFCHLPLFSLSEYRLSALAHFAVGAAQVRCEFSGMPVWRYTWAMCARRAVCRRVAGRSASWTLW